jgi:AraC-like DNA-binding protein
MMARIRAFIERHLADPDLSPATIAAAHHISTRTLHKLYKAERHPVAASIRRRRLERCRLDLLDPAGPPARSAPWGPGGVFRTRPRSAARSALLTVCRPASTGLSTKADPRRPEKGGRPGERRAQIRSQRQAKRAGTPGTLSDRVTPRVSGNPWDYESLPVRHGVPTLRYDPAPADARQSPQPGCIG